MTFYVASFLIVLTFRIYSVESLNGALVQQYHQCKLLKMIPKNSSFSNTLYGGGLVYTPDPNVKNNTLSEAFYQRQGYGNMTIEKSFEVVKKIYDEIANCRNSTCECIKSYVFNEVDDHSAMFRNATFMTQARLIVSAFIQKYKSFVIPESRLLELAQHFNLDFGATMIKFIINTDYSLQRIHIYNEEIISNEFEAFLNEDIDFSLQDTCDMTSRVVNRAVILNPTIAQYEQKLKCYLLNFVNSTVEIQRFNALNIMVVVFPQMVSALNLGNQMLSAYLDRIQNMSRAYRPQVMYSSIGLTIDSNSITINRFYNDSETIYEARNASQLLFNSSMYRIDAELVFVYDSELLSRLRWLNLTVFLDSKSKPSSLSLNIFESKLSTSVKNGTILTDSTKKSNVLQVLTESDKIHIYHFDSNSRISLTGQQELKITAPVRFFEIGAPNGLLMKRPDEQPVAID